MIKAIIRRNWQMYKRYFPLVHFIDRIIGDAFELLGFWLIANYLFQNKVLLQQGQEISDYFTYAAIGMIYFSTTIAIQMNVGRSLITEVREGTLESMLVSPYNIIKYYIGVFIEQFGRTLIEFFLIFGVALCFGADLFRISLLDWSVSFIYLSLISFAMGVFLSNIMLWFRETFISQNTLFVLIFLVSGVTFPRAVLPGFLRIIGDFIPLTQALDLIRDLTEAKHLMVFSDARFYIGLASASLYFIFGILIYKKIEQKVINYVSY